MVRVLRVASAVTIAVAALSACSSSDDANSASSTTTEATHAVAEPISKPTTSKRAPIPVAGQNDDTHSEPGSIPLPKLLSVRTMQTPVGTIMVTPSGRAVYYYLGDDPKTGKSSCDDQCAIHWPPVTANSQPPTGDGVKAELGISDRPNGATQLTVNGRPVYFYRNDETPGSINGQGLAGVWWLVGPNGQMIKPK